VGPADHVTDPQHFQELTVTMRMSIVRYRTIRVALAAGAVGVALFTAACGSSTATGGIDHASTAPTRSAAAATGFNDADVAFATDMIPHHRQALQMAQLAQSRAVTPAVKDLAGRISQAQQPEITTMSGWLSAWGKPIPDANPMPGMTSAMPGMASAMPGMSTTPATGPDMPGMMSDQEMTQLTKTTGTAFDTMFLTMMIKHHQGAVQMARTEQAQGVNPEAKKLAGTIASSQTGEITEMQTLLGKM
jgi:uncharacterized protein (DUF305 family)